MVTVDTATGESISGHIGHLNVALHAWHSCVTSEVFLLGFEEARVVNFQRYRKLALASDL
jgi:hypothetical protein